MFSAQSNASVVRFSKGVSIGKKILVGNILFLILPMLIAFSLILFYTVNRLDLSTEAGLKASCTSLTQMLEVSINTALHEHLRGIAQKNLQITQAYYEKVQAGVLTKQQATRQLFTIFATQKIGPSGYVYCLNSQGVPQYHPQQLLIGQDIINMPEFRSYLAFISRQLTKKKGFIEYTWKNPTEKVPSAKALFTVYFEPWDWIISVTCYQREFLSLIDFNAIKDKIATFQYGKSGYAFIANNSGKILIQPRQEQASDFAVVNQQLQTVLQEHNAETTNVIHTQGKNVAMFGESERFLHFKRLPKFGLVVGVTASKHDLFPQYLSIPIILGATLLIGLVLSFSTALLFSRHLATRLRFLTRHLQPSEQSQPAATGSETTDLMLQLDHYLHTLRLANEKLNNEVQIRKSAENFLKIYKKIFDNATEGILITDAQGKILAVNKAFTTITAYEAHEAVGQKVNILKSNHHDPFFFSQLWLSLSNNGFWEGEIWNKKKDGSIHPYWLSINSIYGEAKSITYYFATFFEIGELKKREKQVAFLAYHDLLTKLPNRIFLENKLATALAKCNANGGKIAVFFIDLDNFKNVNDVFGHKQGDELLVQVSQRFNTILREQDSLYRLGSDEFIILMEDIENESIIYLMANRLLALLKKPFLLEFKKIYVNTSIGIALYPGDGENGLELIRSADMAMHKAKREGKNRFTLFTKGMHEQLYEKFRIENGIRYGLLHREFVVYYQPKVNITSLKTSSLEALIRWEKGGRLISPGAFIPIAEESSLIDDICLFVLEETCAFLAEMKKRQVIVPISVNISPRQFHNADFIDFIEDLLNRYAVEPKYVEFEITETTAMKDVEHTLRIMDRIRSMGILFSIDDFGTGYSSLGYLNKMPVSTLKIDKQFIDDLDTNSGIVATIIAISHQMHLNVVAEGVETETQLNSLAAMGCQEAQGFYFSRPVSGEGILQYLNAERLSS